MQITGSIKFIGELQNITNSFSKKEIVVETQETYPQSILLQFTNNNIDRLDHISVGDNVEIKYNLRGRGYNKNGETRYFNTIEGWYIKKV